MRTALGIAIGIGFVVALVLVTLGQARVRCEVCMEHGGGRVCEAAAAPDRDQALAQARNTACAQLSNGVTDGIACNNAAPATVECSK